MHQKFLQPLLFFLPPDQDNFMYVQVSIRLRSAPFKFLKLNGAEFSLAWVCLNFSEVPIEDFTVHCSLHTKQWTLNTRHTAHCTLHTAHCTLYTASSLLFPSSRGLETSDSGFSSLNSYSLWQVSEVKVSVYSFNRSAVQCSAVQCSEVHLNGSYCPVNSPSHGWSVSAASFQSSSRLRQNSSLQQNTGLGSYQVKRGRHGEAASGHHFWKNKKKIKKKK